MMSAVYAIGRPPLRLSCVRLRPRRAATAALIRAMACLALAWLAGADLAARADAVPEPDGYRLADYRAPTPASLRGARTVTTEEAAALWRDKGAVFLDVMPRAPRPANLPADTLWRDKPRFNIPGSVWLPDTGYGALAAATEAYLRNGLARLTGGDATRPVVVYCQRDCWMSWNAAKRALSWGYSNILWFPDGTEGWQETDLPLEDAKPLPVEVR
jgi:PQQ-dependent catabolism-associated CXXCW motif protein